MKQETNRTQSLYSFDFHRFKTIVSMLLKDTVHLDFKHNFKQSLIRLSFYVLSFALVCGLSFVFFYVSDLLRIFSYYRTISPSVPSILVMAVFLFGFIPSSFSLNRLLYWSKDNRLLISLPCSSTTVFSAKIAVFFFSQYLRAVMIEIPFLLGYLIFRRGAFYLYLWCFVAWFFFVLAKVMINAVFSVPFYYVDRYFKKHNLALILLSVIFFGALIFLIFYFISLMPNALDISTIWPKVQNRVNDALLYYQIHFRFFQRLTSFSIGNFYLNGDGFAFMTWENFLAFLITFGVTVICFFISYFLVGKKFFSLASSGNDFIVRPKERDIKLKKHSAAISQIRKEAILFFTDPDTFVSILETFVFLPIFLAFMNKIFGAFKINFVGAKMVHAFNLLLILVVAFSSCTTIAKIYDKEGDAFLLTRTYPGKESWMLFSKLVLPLAMGLISILLTVGIISSIRSYSIGLFFILAFAISLIFIGHVLYSASLDFTNRRREFASEDFATPSEKRSVIIGLILSLVVSVFYYMFEGDTYTWWGTGVEMTSAIKILIFAIAYFAFQVFLYQKKVKYVYLRGDTL